VFLMARIWTQGVGLATRLLGKPLSECKPRKSWAFLGKTQDDSRSMVLAAGMR
jgi:hypothetical protein